MVYGEQKEPEKKDLASFLIIIIIIIINEYLHRIKPSVINIYTDIHI